MKSHSILAAALACLAVSCSNPFSSVVPWTPNASVRIYSYTEIGLDSSRVHHEVEALFRDENLKPYDMSDGSVTVDGREIARGPAPNSALATLAQFNETFDTASTIVKYNGTPYVVRFTGSKSFPAFSDSILAERTPLVRATPGPADTVSKSDGMTVRWEGVPGTADSLYITILSPIGEGEILPWIKVRDNGSYRFAVSQIRNLSNGPVVITLLRSRTITRELTGNFKYTIDVLSQLTIRTNLTD